MPRPQPVHTDAQMRDIWSWPPPETPGDPAYLELVAQWDRWLAAHDAQVRAATLAEVKSMSQGQVDTLRGLW